MNLPFFSHITQICNIFQLWGACTGGHGGSRDYVASAGSSPSNNPIIKREHCCALSLCYLVADNLVKQQTRH